MSADDETVQYTRADLIAHLREHADDGQMPSITTINSLSGPSARPYKHRFGSWNEAADAAGLEPNEQGRENVYTEDELIAHLRKHADDGQMPSATTINSISGPSTGAYKHRFGSWNEAGDAAGLEPNDVGGQYSEAELIEWLQSWAATFGAPPRANDFKDPDAPTPGLVPYLRVFGSWEAALEAAGLTEVGDE